MNLPLPASETENQVAQLARACPIYSADIKVREILATFHDDENLRTIVLTDHDIPVGLINRYRLNELFSKEFTRELYGNRPVRDFMLSNPVIVTTRTSVDDLTRIIVEDKTQAMDDGFILTEDGRCVGIGYGQDLLQLLSERKQEHLFRLAHFDSLTGLSNRLMFLNRLEQGCLRAERSGQQLTLMFIDLDRFKAINDSLGHAAGDELLVEVSRRFTQLIRKTDEVARLGGDEFTVLLEDVGNEDKAIEIANKLVEAVRAPIQIRDLEVTVTASIGISFFPADASGPEELQQNADAAMYQAKTDGKDRCVVFDSSMLGSGRASLSMEGQLRKALSRGEFRVYYQPQIDLRSERIIGVESLLRWDRPEHGVIGPDQFLEMADRLGLMDEIGFFVLNETVDQISAWGDRFDIELAASVNVTFSQLENPRLLDVLRDLLDRSEINPQKLTFEITEQTIMKSPEKAQRAIAGLKELGIQVAIDDFGTGYSSLGYLLDLPIDILKIDRVFIKSIERGRKAQSLVRAILAMAQNLDMTIVAEGVETVMQRDFIKQHGCHFVQGFLYSRPEAAETVERNFLLKM